MWEGIFDKILDAPGEMIDKFRWEKLDYSFDGKNYEFYFMKDGKIIIENWDIKKEFLVATNTKERYNQSMTQILNFLTGKEYPNRPTIWKEVNLIYDKLFWKEQNEIKKETQSKTFWLVDEIEQKWEEVLNDIEWLIDEWYFVLRMLFKELYENFFWEDIQNIDIRWMNLIYNREFMNAIQELSGEIWCNPEDLIFVMYCESKLDPKAINKYSDATWLLQWLPSTAQWLWTTTEKLLQLPAKDQLIYVYKFLQQNDRWQILNTPQKLYASVFYPKYLEHINEPNYVFWSHVSTKNAIKIANQNPAIVRYSKRKINGKCIQNQWQKRCNKQCISNEKTIENQ